MRMLKYCLPAFILLLAQPSYAQTVNKCGIWFDYDAAGNRIKRYYDCKDIDLSGSGVGPGNGARYAKGPVNEPADKEQRPIVAPNPTIGPYTITLPKEGTPVHFHWYDAKGSIIASGLFSAASHRQQEAIGELLSRAAGALTDELRKELTAKGLPESKLKSVDALAASYSKQNIAQEGHKIARKTLTDDDVKALNALYNEVMTVAKTGQDVFRNDRAKKDGYVFEKVVPQSSRGGAANNPPAPPAA